MSARAGAAATSWGPAGDYTQHSAQQLSDQTLLRITGEDRLSRQMAGSRRSVIGPPGNLGSNTDLSSTNYNSGAVI